MKSQVWMLSVSLLLMYGTIGVGEKPKPVVEEPKTAVEEPDAVAGEIVNSIGMKLILIPAGEFLMGSPESDQLASPREKPQHKVRITQPFYLGVTEVTQEQWRSVMETEPWKDQRLVEEDADYPATNVSWDDAVEFCKRLGTKEGVNYRLPTEAEWEYACRGGTTSMYHFGDDRSRLGDYAWWGAFGVGNCQDEKYAHRVGQKEANPFGLCDMHGNVFEWCLDWFGESYYGESPENDPKGPFQGTYRVYRGGSWSFSSRHCRSAFRRRYLPGFQSISLGFRVAGSLSSE